MKYAVYTLGCKVNSCESAAIASAFDTKGFEQCKQGEIADIFFIITMLCFKSVVGIS